MTNHEKHYYAVGFRVLFTFIAVISFAMIAALIMLLFAKYVAMPILE